jgi:polyisoprenoid-binding protein YceI
MTWRIDPTHTEIGFRGKHMLVSTVKGKFTEFEGEFAIDEDDLVHSGAELKIKAASLETGFDQRDQHLRSADFFNVDEYPEISFSTRRVERNGSEATFRVAGDLTIRDVTREVEFDLEAAGPVEDPWGGTRIAVSGEAVVDRRDWGLEWNVPLGMGRMLVGDKITLSLDAELVKAA